MSDVRIRDAERGDVEELRALFDEFHACHVRGVPRYLRIPGAGAEELDTTVQRLLAGADSTLLVAESGARIVGVAEVRLDPVSESPFAVPRRVAILQSLFVSEDARGNGLGRKLVAACERWAVERGAEELRAEELRAKAWEFGGGPSAFYEKIRYRTLIREFARDL